MGVKHHCAILVWAGALALLLALVWLPQKVLALSCSSQNDGNWNDASRWSCGRIPTAEDDVTVAHAVSLSAAAVTNNLTIDSGGSLSLGGYGLTISGNFTNNGSFSAGSGTVTFNRDGDQTISGTSTTNFYILALNMGSSNTNVLDVLSPITINSGNLTLSNGTFKLSSDSNLAISSGSYTIPASGGLWVNGGTVGIGTSSGSLILYGSLRVSDGALNIGNSFGNSLRYHTGSTLTFEGGIINIAGRLARDGSSTQTTSYSQSGGVVTVVTKGSGDSTYAGFDIGAAGSSFTMSGGSIIIQQSTSAPQDYYNVASTYSSTGGTLQIGNDSTLTGQTIRINSTVPVFHLKIYSVNAPTAQLVSNDLTVNGDFNIQAGAVFNTNGRAINLSGDFGNSGTFTHNNGTVTLNGSNPQSIAGASDFYNLAVNNAAGVSLNGDQTVAGTLTLNNGLLSLGSYHLTLGGAAAIAGSPSASAMIVPTGSGELRKTFTGAGSFTFPVGDHSSTAEYSPVTLNFSEGTFSSAYAAVRLVDDKHPNNGASDKYLTRYWTVTQSGISDFDCTATFSYVQDDVVGDEANIAGTKWNGSAWTQLGQVNAETNQFSGAVDSFSDFSGGPYEPTNAPLAGFTAAAVPAGIALQWQTSVELDLLGFHLYRADSALGAQSRLNASLIPAGGLGSAAGYALLDGGVLPGGRYFYWLELVSIAGSTLVGPVESSYYRLFAPLVALIP